MRTPRKHYASRVGTERGAEVKAEAIGYTDVTPYIEVALSVILDKMPGNAAMTQRDRLRAALAITPLTTIDCRDHLAIMHPAQRCLELRDEGMDIATVWVRQEDCLGRSHRVGKYVLQAGGDHE